MKALVLYYSKGGNTRRLAEAIAEGVGQLDGVEAVMRHTRDVTKDDFVEADGLIVGSPVYFGTMAAQLKKVLDVLKLANETTNKQLEAIDNMNIKSYEYPRSEYIIPPSAKSKDKEESEE